ncbi:MAG: ribonuclease domain-containing protein [Corynebacterium sp.]|nr:ribonuclease domain-containing protein [Corynebacterium sp.]
MGNRKKTIPAIVGGIILAALASYFGFDTVQDASHQSAAVTTTATNVVKQSKNSAKSSAAATASAKKTAATPNAGFDKFQQCRVDTLPQEADETIDDILAGGPYDYPADDNKHFGNYERQLPNINRNYYREYTVKTPGLKHRGERRIVTGGGSETDPDVWLYTKDHYQTFCVIPDAEN